MKHILIHSRFGHRHPIHEAVEVCEDRHEGVDQGGVMGRRDVTAVVGAWRPRGWRVWTLSIKQPVASAPPPLREAVSLFLQAASKNRCSMIFA